MLAITTSDSSLLVILYLIVFLFGMCIGGMLASRQSVDRISTLTKQRNKARSTNKFLLGQIKGFAKTGDRLLSLTVKLLESLDKNKLRIIRNFRGQLRWAEKYLEKQK